MLELALAAILAAAVTVAEGGLVFQPALSPDGAKVAYAQDDGGEVSIWIAASSGQGPRTRVASVGSGVLGQRLAARALLHRPWSADGTRLLYLQRAVDGKSEILHVVAADGTGARPVGPSEGLIESASWLAGNEIVFTHRGSRRDDDQRVHVLDVEKGGPPREVMLYREGAVTVDIAPSPDGKWLATIHLSGPRDERSRAVRLLRADGTRQIEVAHTGSANFLTWSRDSKKLFYVDTRSADVPVYEIELELGGPPVCRGARAVAMLDGALLALETGGALAAFEIETGQRSKDLGADHVPVSVAGTRVAFVRRGPSGAAVVLADATKEAVAAGDLGLPLPPKSSAPAPSPPGEKPPPDQPPAPPSDGSPPGNGAVVPEVPPPPPPG